MQLNQATIRINTPDTEPVAYNARIIRIHASGWVEIHDAQAIHETDYQNHSDLPASTVLPPTAIASITPGPYLPPATKSDSHADTWALLASHGGYLRTGLQDDRKRFAETGHSNEPESAVTAINQLAGILETRHVLRQDHLTIQDLTHGHTLHTRLAKQLTPDDYDGYLIADSRLVPMAVLTGSRKALNTYRNLRQSAETSEPRPSSKAAYLRIAAITELANQTLDNPNLEDITATIQEWRDSSDELDPGEQRRHNLQADLLTAVANRDESAITELANQTCRYRATTIRNNPDPGCVALVDFWSTAILVCGHRQNLDVPTSHPGMPVNASSQDWQD